MSITLTSGRRQDTSNIRPPNVVSIVLLAAPILIGLALTV